MATLLAFRIFGLPLPFFLVLLALFATVVVVALVLLEDRRRQRVEHAHQQLTREVQQRDAGKPFSPII
jgi:hypothetical protein